MSKARILADYVAGGTTAAEFDYMDGVTSNVQTQMDAKAPLASPVLVTPNLGTPSAGVVTNLSGTLASGVQDNITRLGTIATTTHGKYVLEDVEVKWENAAHTLAYSNDPSGRLNNINIFGSNYATLVTGSNTDDLITFEMDFGTMYRSTGFMGVGLARADDNTFSTNNTLLWASGSHSIGGDPLPETYNPLEYNRTRTVANWGFSASTTYYLRLIGQVHSVAATYIWGASVSEKEDSRGMKLTYFKWREV